MKFFEALLQPRAVRVLWALVFISLLIWVAVPNYVLLWDLQIYRTAVLSLRAGHDPYLDAMSVQRIFHAHFAEHPNATPPYSYVYSPITLPLLRLIAHSSIPFWGVVFGICYVLGIGSIVRFGLQLARQGEQSLFAFLAPILLFFPGLLHQDTVWSGNVALILYGAVLACTLYGVKRGRWWPLYVAVVIASCFKAPLLTLLAIPVLCARGQVWKAGLGALVGTSLFALQPLLWPNLFRHFLQAVDLQFLFNRDFGSSPAGVVANLLYMVAPYRIVSLVAYVAYAVPTAVILYRLSLLYRRGRLDWQDWAPVMFVGVVLLNPRLMEYDLEPLALPMALLLWRALSRRMRAQRTAIAFFASLTAINLLAIVAWKPTECVVLLLVFGFGAWDLARERKSERTDRHAEMHSLAELHAS